MLTANGLVIDCAGLPAVLRNATTVTVTAQSVVVEATNATVKASGKARVESPTLEVTGDVVSRADETRVSLNDLRDAYALHKHAGVRSGTEVTGLTDHSA